MWESVPPQHYSLPQICLSVENLLKNGARFPAPRIKENIALVQFWGPESGHCFLPETRARSPKFMTQSLKTRALARRTSQGQPASLRRPCSTPQRLAHRCIHVTRFRTLFACTAEDPRQLMNCRVSVWSDHCLHNASFDGARPSSSLALPLTKALDKDRSSLVPSYADAKTTRSLVFRLPIRKHGQRPCTRPARGLQAT